MKYNVDISPDAKKELNNYISGAMEFGSETVSKILDAFDEWICILETTPNAGFDKLKYISAKYKVIHLLKHYWMIFQIYEDEHCVKIDYVIDDRQNYGRFVH